MTTTRPDLGPVPETNNANHLLRALVIGGALLFALLFVIVGGAFGGGDDPTDVELIGIGEQVPDSPTGRFVTDRETPIPAARTGTHQPLAGLDADDPLTAAGFYFGTEGRSECDRDLFGFAVSQDGDLAAAVAKLMAVNQDRMSQWINQLTPGYLPGDTRVTRNGWNGSALTSRQAVLQSGTAVLVDATGEPVVLCNGGSLLEAPDRWDTPRFRGNEWSDFDADALLTIDAGEDPGRFAVRVDPTTGDGFMRHVGVVDPPPAPGAKDLEITLTWEGSDDDLDLHVTEPDGTLVNFETQTEISPGGGGITPSVDPPGDSGVHVERVYYPSAPAGTFTLEVFDHDVGSVDDTEVCLTVSVKVNGKEVPGSEQSGCEASDDSDDTADGFGHLLGRLTLTCDETGAELSPAVVPGPTVPSPPTTTVSPSTTVPTVTADGQDITGTGIVFAVESTSCDGQFAALGGGFGPAIDGDPSTGYFHKASTTGNTGYLLWGPNADSSGPPAAPFPISRVEVTGLGQVLPVAAIANGFGSVTVEVLDQSFNPLWNSGPQTIAQAADPDVSVVPPSGTTGSFVSFTFTAPTMPDCAGIGELRVFG